MKYGENEQYVRHVDYYNREERFFGHDLDKFGGQRIKTALLYLTTAEEGGETVFHKAAKENSVGKNSCAGKCGPHIDAVHCRAWTVPANADRTGSQPLKHLSPCRKWPFKPILLSVCLCHKAPSWHLGHEVISTTAQLTDRNIQPASVHLLQLPCTVPWVLACPSAHLAFPLANSHA